MFEITYNDGNIQSMLKRIMAIERNTQPVMKQIGEVVMEISKRSFDNSASPDGTPWAANTEATILHYLYRISGVFIDYTDVNTRKERQYKEATKKGYFKKDGMLTKKAQDRIMNKRPLIGESGDLKRQFSYTATADSVTVTNSKVYAAMQQFGGTKQQFPHLWGDIPARPFMPMADDGGLMPVAEAEVLQVMQDYLDTLIS